MNHQEFKKGIRRIYSASLIFFGMLILGAGGLVYKMINPSFLEFNTTLTNNNYINVADIDFNTIENGIHVATGFKDDKGLQAVIFSCTPCHSAKLVTQNRANKEGWINVIRWMQETQNLWDLGANEEIIVNYLAKNYAPEDKGRRDILENIEWYELED